AHAGPGVRARVGADPPARAVAVVPAALASVGRRVARRLQRVGGAVRVPETGDAGVRAGVAARGRPRARPVRGALHALAGAAHRLRAAAGDVGGAERPGRAGPGVETDVVEVGGAGGGAAPDLVLEDEVRRAGVEGELLGVP